MGPQSFSAIWPLVNYLSVAKALVLNAKSILWPHSLIDRQITSLSQKKTPPRRGEKGDNWQQVQTNRLHEAPKNTIFQPHIYYPSFLISHLQISHPSLPTHSFFSISLFSRFSDFFPRLRVPLNLTFLPSSHFPFTNPGGMMPILDNDFFVLYCQTLLRPANPILNKSHPARLREFFRKSQIANRKSQTANRKPQMKERVFLLIQIKKNLVDTFS